MAQIKAYLDGRCVRKLVGIRKKQEVSFLSQDPRGNPSLLGSYILWLSTSLIQGSQKLPCVFYRKKSQSLVNNEL